MRLATLGALPPPQRKDLRGLPLARNQSTSALWPSCLSGVQCDDVTLSPFGYGKNVIGPTFERPPLIAIVGRLVVNAGDTGLMADVTEDTLDDVRRDAEPIVHDGRGGTAKIVQHPSRHRLGNVGDLAGGRDPLVKRSLRRRPGDKSRSPATEVR